MSVKKISAFVRLTYLNQVREGLEHIEVKGASSYRVLGFGEYVNPLHPHKPETYAKLEIFTAEANVQRIATAIMDICSTGMEGDGIVTILPVERVYRIRTKQEASEDEI